MSWGRGQLLEPGKSIILWANAEFFGQKQAAKGENMPLY